MDIDYLTEVSPRVALDKIFQNSPKHSQIKLISCIDKYGDMFITETQKIFIPSSNNYSRKADIDSIRHILYKPRKSKRITVGGLKRYLNYISKRAFKNKGELLSDCPCEKENDKYDLTDDGTGKKYDNGKPMAGTLTDVFSRALMAVGACIEFGTHKYPDPKNWQLVDNGIKRYRDAMVRHLLKYNAGIEKDEETGLPHLAHMCWNALAILELYMQEHKDELDKEIFK